MNLKKVKILEKAVNTHETIFNKYFKMTSYVCVHKSDFPICQAPNNNLH